MGSGKPLQRRIDDGDLRAPEMRTTTLRSTAASSGRVRRVCSSTGSGRSSGTHSGSEGVAVAPVTASAAMGSARALEGERAEEGEERGRARGVPGRVRERPGVSWRLQAHRGGRQPGRRWPSATAVLATELLRALAREEDRRRGGQVGWAAQVGCTVLGCGWLPGKLR